MIKLYGIRQSRALRSLWAIEELGIPYEHVATNFNPDVARWLAECSARPSFAKAQRG